MRAYLILKDGTIFCGRSFGGTAPFAQDLAGFEEFSKGIGEVVFNTGMTGYHEILTDPSYTGQIVAMTYPHMGNYGTDSAWSEHGPENRPLTPVKAQGFVVREYYDGPLPGGRQSLADFLSESKTPGITDIDTRRLTLHLREQGSQNGVILAPTTGNELTADEIEAAQSYLEGFPSMEGRNCIARVGLQGTTEEICQGGLTLAIVDCGIKGNIIRSMESFGLRLLLFPSTATAEEILRENPMGVLYGNGPGDPATLQPLIDEIRKLVGRVPLFGICLGHQLIASALGAKTRKMNFGHHGCNNPVRDELTGRVAVTSQNHGFDVDETTLPAGSEIWFRNANDRTVEGIYHTDYRILTSQFHPEAAPGPFDSLWIFERFYDELKKFAASTDGTAAEEA